MVLLSACAVHTVFLDDDVLLVELLLDLPSRLSFSLGAFLAAEGFLSRTTYSLLLPAFVCMVAPPCGAKAHGSAHMASVCISSHQSARASSLTWLVRVEPCQSRESLAYMPRDSCATPPACASAPVHVEAHIHMHIQVYNWLHVIACGCLY